MISSNEPAIAERERLMHVIDRDRYAAAACVNAIDFVLHSRRWLREAGRGSYVYDDERYQEEFGLAFDEIMEALRPMRALAKDKTDCTTDPEKVSAARTAGSERFAALSPPAASAETGLYHARESFGNWYVEKQFSCINGLSAWFSLATVSPPDEAAIGYTDGAIPDAENFAKRVAAALNTALSAAPSAPATEAGEGA